MRLFCLCLFLIFPLSGVAETPATDATPVAPISKTVVVYGGDVKVAGVPSDGSVMMRFVLFEGETGGKALWRSWTDAKTWHPVQLSGGAFKVALGHEGQQSLPKGFLEKHPNPFVQVFIKTGDSGTEHILPRAALMKSGPDTKDNGPMQNVFGSSEGFDSKLNAAMAGSGGDLVIGNGSGGMGMRGSSRGTGYGQVHGMGRVSGKGRGVRARLGGKKRSKKRARVRRGKGTFTGFCKKRDILKVVKRRQKGIQFCYEKELARNPSLGGKVIMSWTIDTHGKAEKASVHSSSLGNKSVEGCIVRNINRWRFKKPEGGVCTVKFPFVFNPGL